MKILKTSRALKLFIAALLWSSASMAQGERVQKAEGLSPEIKSLIKAVLATQQTINSVSYELSRRDTIGTHIREMKGMVEMEKYTADTVFGFKFWSKKTGDPMLKVFDGHVGYELDEDVKTYQTTVSAAGFRNLLNGGGGHLVMQDLMLLDTSKAVKVELTEDARFYTLKFSYADLEQYDVEKRYKEV